MKPDGRDHQNSHLHAADHGASRQKSGQCFAKAHLIGKHGTATGQQPTHPSPLMSQQLTAIRQGFQQIGCSDQLPMGRQRRQWLLQSVKPLLQLRINGKPLCELLLQAQGCFQGKDPTPLAGLPTATGANAP